MLRITVELIPLGNEKKKEQLAQIIIANEGGPANSDERHYRFEGWVNDWGFVRYFGGNAKHNRCENVLSLLSAVLKHTKFLPN